MVKSREVKSKSVVDLDRYHYLSRGCKTSSGKRLAVDNGDPIAAALRGKSPKQLDSIARENGLEVPSKLYHGRNAGIIRLAFGNTLRGMFNRGDTVMIEGRRMRTQATKLSQGRSKQRAPRTKAA